MSHKDIEVFIYGTSIKAMELILKSCLPAEEVVSYLSVRSSYKDFWKDYLQKQKFFNWSTEIIKSEDGKHKPQDKSSAFIFPLVTKFHVCRINEIEPKGMHKSKEEILEAASLSSE